MTALNRGAMVLGEDRADAAHRDGETHEPAVAATVVVDDTPDIRLLLRLALDLESDFTVVGEAGDGLEAIEVVAALRPDVIVIDLAMPRMDGLEALPRLRALCPEATILVLSGFDDPVLSGKAVTAGADGYLRKGASPMDIVARLRDLRGVTTTGSPTTASAASARSPEPSPAQPSAQPPAARLWAVSSELLQSAPFGLVNVTTDDRGTRWVVSANDSACEALDLWGAALPGRLAELSPALDDLIGLEPADDREQAADDERLGEREDLTVRLHRDRQGVTAVLMPHASAPETARLRRAIASIAHEMRNPVTILAGATHALSRSRGQIDAELEHQLFEAIDRQARQLERATADLVTAVQRRAGTFDVQLAPVELRPLLAACLASHLDVGHVEVGGPGDLWACADAGRLEQMVTNLLSNALKYGAPPVRVDLGASEGIVSVRVSDAGPGVSPTFVPQLFDEFTRERGHRVQGTGLGLHVVRSLAEAQNGHVGYSRTTDHRTRFEITLPRALPGGAG